MLSLGVINCEFHKCMKLINSTNLVAYIQKSKGNMYIFIGNMVSTKQTGSEVYLITFCGIKANRCILKLSLNEIPLKALICVAFSKTKLCIPDEDSQKII